MSAKIDEVSKNAKSEGMPIRGGNKMSFGSF